MVLHLRRLMALACFPCCVAGDDSPALADLLPPEEVPRPVVLAAETYCPVALAGSAAAGAV